MGVLSKYWTIIKLDASGGCRPEEIASAKAFFTQVFPTLTPENESTDASIQAALIPYIKQQKEIEKSLLAERCLLCFISHQIVTICRHIEKQFGYLHGFNCADLFPFVLDDDGKIPSHELGNATPQYQSFSRIILKSFDPLQSSLSTWTNLKVKHHSELNKFLLERGVYQVSDWAILNDTAVKQIERIFSNNYQLTQLECQQASELLESYHAVYRTARLQQRQAGMRRQCQPPTTEQLQQICQLLEIKNNRKLSPEAVMVKLQKMAAQLRKYRILVRGGSPPTESIDTSDSGFFVNQLPSPDLANELESQAEQTEFLKSYRPLFLTCLEEAIARVTDYWVSELQQKNARKSQQFLTALQLFHCQGRSMGEIAAKVGLQAQYQVTRLLKLKSFRADVRQQLLILLRDRVQELAKYYADRQHLQTLDRQIEEALDEQIVKVIEEAEIEASTGKNGPQSSLFSQKLCHHLDTLI